ncbi:MAG: flagellar biosynthesis protein FlhB [Lachnospiraceae bacterium]|nr:flagellar biosynthesis protein FlhB [Lachnospiraceae bacterium]
MNEKEFNQKYNKKQFHINKSKKAVALAYTKGEQAPKVVASGKGNIAEKIIEKAQESNVPIHEDEKLVDSLATLDVGEYIPPELYEVVAEVLVYVDDMDRIKSKL